MLKPLFKFEAGLLRVEKWILVICVLLMLALAGYTVFYRNVLISVQSYLATSGPPVVEQVDPVEDEPDEVGSQPAEDTADDDFGGGFGGGFGGAEEPEDDAADDADDESDFGRGFGGGFGADESADGAAGEGDDEQNDFGGGFGGGFGDTEAGETDEPDSPAPAAGRTPVEVAQTSPAEPRGGPPPEGSFAARVVELIDDVKFHWLDTLLRQLVIICGFLGAMLASRHRSHITIDAVGKLLKGRPEHVVHVVTSLVAAVVCVFLAVSGTHLVEISREFPRQIIPWLDDWHFQLAFPVGWSVLAFHFLMRAVESAHLALGDPEADAPDSQPHQEVL